MSGRQLGGQPRRANKNRATCHLRQCTAVLLCRARPVRGRGASCNGSAGLAAAERCSSFFLCTLFASDTSAVPVHLQPTLSRQLRSSAGGGWGQGRTASVRLAGPHAQPARQQQRRGAQAKSRRGWRGKHHEPRVSSMRGLHASVRRQEMNVLA